jgi:hypothetical protein
MENLRGIIHVRDLGIDGKLLLKWNFENQVVSMLI